MSALSLRTAPFISVPCPLAAPAPAPTEPEPKASSPRPTRTVHMAPQLPEPLQQRMAAYELERAVAYAAVPDLARMQHRLESACTDLAQMDGSAGRIEAARHAVMEALYQRALDAAEAGQVEQTQTLWSRIELLAGQCTQAPEWVKDGGLPLLDSAHAAASARAAGEAGYSAEFGDACRLRLQLDEVARHPGPWALSAADQAFLVALCSRRLADPDTSLLIRMPGAEFVQAQVAALEALAADMGQPFPEEISEIAAMISLDSSSQEALELWDSHSDHEREPGSNRH